MIKHWWQYLPEKWMPLQIYIRNLDDGIRRHGGIKGDLKSRRTMRGYRRKATK